MVGGPCVKETLDHQQLLMTKNWLKRRKAW